ncbi:MAG TPA: RagB/SusD family nutrient uptake outer membrane protein [Saprospiraceae bacterium]|nr:RagB/SusD family nutrient uptake outer membrane protein [Saprospiraceae bacterium]
MKNICIIAIGVFFFLSLPSCSDLTPEFKDVIIEENFFKSDAEFIAALGSAYTNLYGMCNHQTYFSLQECSSDEATIPHKGPDWEDGKQWIKMYRHTFTPGEGVINNTWNFCYGGINTCNRLIFTFEKAGGAGADAFIAELKSLRAYYYLILLDVFGNVPIVTQFDVPVGFKPTTESRQNVYNFVESELTTQVPLLSRDVNLSTYARVNYYVGQMMLVNLYLNAEVYTGTPQWQKAIDAANEIVNSGAYTLESNYFANFAINNSGSKENIFVIPYDAINAPGFNMCQMTLHYESQKTFNLIEQPWNGYTTLADFYNSFTADDARLTGGGQRAYGVLLYGPQYDAAGVRLVDNSDLWFPDTDGRLVNFNPVLNQLEPTAERDGGARISKYEYELKSRQSMNNDFAIYRYGDVLLSKAEALYRLNAGSGEALDLVNMIRTRAKVAAFGSLTDDNLLAERGREMCFETKRRTDLIRFGHFGDARWEKPADDGAYRTIMPIPTGQLQVNSNLVQNPGY